jgi:hypothetical protein
MPRKARLNVPEAVHRIMSRSIDHHALFSEDASANSFSL